MEDSLVFVDGLLVVEDPTQPGRVVSLFGVPTDNVTDGKHQRSQERW